MIWPVSSAAGSRPRSPGPERERTVAALGGDRDRPWNPETGSRPNPVPGRSGPVARPVAERSVDSPSRLPVFLPVVPHNDDNAV